MRVLSLLWDRTAQGGDGLPFWWSQELEQVLEEWKTVPENEAEQMLREAREAEMESRVGIQLKHTPQELAAMLLWKAGKGDLPAVS